MSSKNDLNTALAAHAESVRKNVPRAAQAELFRIAIEAGCLAAFADLDIDSDERAAIVTAVGLLSVGDVVEAQADALVDVCEKRISKEGIPARIRAVGQALERMGQVEAGLTIAALVADASGGIDELEHEVLEDIGKAASAAPGLLERIVANVTRRP